MSKKRRSYSREFKVEAVALVTKGGLNICQVASDLGINPNVLGRWWKQLEADSEQAFPGKGPVKPQDEELFRLRRELAIMAQKRDILKKQWASSRGCPNEASVYQRP